MRKSAYLIVLLLIIFLIITSYAISDTRGINVINDLSHSSGELGAYRALIIGINDYKDPKLPALETALNDASALAELLRERYGFFDYLALALSVRLGHRHNAFADCGHLRPAVEIDDCGDDVAAERRTNL